MEITTFNQFKENLSKDVQKALGSGFEVELRTVEKMNDTYDALTVKPVDSVIGVNLNVTTLYDDYTEGKTYDMIVDNAANIAKEALEQSPEFDIESYKDYNVMKDKLAIEVVSRDKNASLLETVPHKIIEDLAIVYRFIISDDVKQRTATILVTNALLECYGITVDQLHADAQANAPVIRPLVIQGMSEVLAKQMGEESLEVMGLNIPPEQEQMFVATVEGSVHGAGVLAYQEFMDKASERVGGDFFILPSSIHELLIIPDDGKFDLASLEQMVREVNATTVDPSDQLTDNVYHYDSKNKIFELGEKYIERKNALSEDIA